MRQSNTDQVIRRRQRRRLRLTGRPGGRAKAWNPPLNPRPRSVVSCISDSNLPIIHVLDRPGDDDAAAAFLHRQHVVLFACVKIKLAGWRLLRGDTLIK